MILSLSNRCRECVNNRRGGGGVEAIFVLKGGHIRTEGGYIRTEGGAIFALKGGGLYSY